MLTIELNPDTRVFTILGTAYTHTDLAGLIGYVPIDKDGITRVNLKYKDREHMFVRLHSPCLWVDEIGNWFTVMAKTSKSKTKPKL
jgi:hypothetical protein